MLFLKTLCIRSKQNLTKTLLIMKLTAILIMAACLQVSAKSYSQKVTLSMSDAPLQKVFKEIKKQTGYNFLYTYELMQKAGKVNIKVQNASLQYALQQCLETTELSYSIVEKIIVIKKKEVLKIENEKAYSNASALPPPPVEIHGTVVNQQGEPLQNVSVSIAGTKIGTTTDNEGRFTLTAPDNRNIVLEISSIGFQTKTVKVGKQTEINVTMEVEVSGLKEVVVGYGTQKKVNLTGAVTQVSSDVLESRPITNLKY
jgi:hypothetical protein